MFYCLKNVTGEDPQTPPSVTLATKYPVTYTLNPHKCLLVREMYYLIYVKQTHLCTFKYPGRKFPVKSGNFAYGKCVLV